MTPPPVVFLPGFMCDERLFAAQTNQLTQLGVGSQVADLSGAASLGEMARTVLERAPRRFCLVGLSMGGILAFEILRRAADRVTHLLLMNTTPKADAAQAQRRQHLARIAQGEFRAIMREDLKPKYFAPANRTEERDRLMMSMAEALGPDVFVRQTLALMRRRAADDMLGSIQCPTIVLAGADDRLCPAQLHHAMASAIPDAELVVLAECGHLSSLEAADEVNSHLLRLIEKPLNLLGLRHKGV
jgi:pimeloyl-ACP methyl ester carboxylesterase